MDDKALGSSRWSLDSVYPGFDSREYAAAKAELSRLAKEECELAAGPSEPEGQGVGDWLWRVIQLQNRSQSLRETLFSYCYAIYSAETGAKRAMAELGEVEEIAVPFSKVFSLYLSSLRSHEEDVRRALREDQRFAPYRSMIEDDLFWAGRTMSAAEEDLAADLARSGASAWSRLQEKMTSTADAVWDEATGERKTLVELRSLAHSPDRAVREKAYRLELAVCASIGVPVAAALNGVKGTTISLNERRGWTGSSAFAAVAKSTRQGLMSEKSLEALIAAMEESLPAWRAYLAAKARLLGLPSLAFYDLFAPVGGEGRTRPFSEARESVISSFSQFSPRFGDFAKKAFDSGWIDSEMRSGKIGGAYFTFMPDAKEGRVLCNYDGSFSSVLTVAHELGHAFHAEILKDEPGRLQHCPMTLAETASIFAETVVFERELSRSPECERLAYLEARLQDGCQILVDILSRYYFERALFDARKKGEVSPEDLCALMTDAQRKTYGDGLDASLYHPYMWLVKPHYYSSDLSFYNFPYAFGQLFALALYDRYRKEGPSFAGVYESILLDTGRMDALEVTRRAGFDIEDIEFWRAGTSVFADQINEFTRLVDATRAHDR
jgi:pepF/M3 family oligoendopeptidase